MTQPNLQIVRERLPLPDGSLHYVVSAVLTSAGTVLPYREVFVVSISDPLNPKSDTLARIATPHDLRVVGMAVYVRLDTTELRQIAGDPFARVANMDELTEMPRDRVTAVRRGASEYLTANIVLEYEALTTADAAEKALRQRVSKLVEDYQMFYGTFRTASPVNYLLPIPDPSVEASLIAAYLEQRNARVTAEAARTAAQAAATACAEADTLLRTKIDWLIQDVAALEQARAVVYGYTESGTSHARTFVLNAGDQRAYEYLLIQKRNELSSAQRDLAARAASCSALGVALAQAEAAVVTAMRDETAALREVYQVCPTYNPDR